MAIPETIQAQKSGIVRMLDPQENVYRLEIDEFVKNEPMMNLFLLALEALQDNRAVHTRSTKEATTPEELEKYWWSFYTIAGESPSFFYTKPYTLKYTRSSRVTSRALGSYAQSSSQRCE